ncbi:MAG: hypothetical protein CMO44_16185 [Verrucomicrobiales bacterium]|nr:hypothetical protein [Verrucomicrobiales bacterium]
MMSASLGFVANSALEAVMTTAIRQVRLCRFKQFCHLPGISVDVAGAPACSWDNVIVSATHSPLGNWARNPTLDGGGKGCAQSGAGVSCAVAVKQTAVALPTLTCDRMRWEDFAIAEAQTYMGSTVYQSEFLDNIQDGIGKSLAVATLVQAFDPTIEAMLIVDHGSTTTLGESIYGNCEKNTEKPGTETITDATGFYSDIDLHHIFPKAPAVGSTGACTCKGQRAYDFSADGGNTHPYRNAAARKVVYDTEYHSNSATDEASLHKCTWLSPAQHSTSNTPLNSVDQFTMSLEFLKRGEDYFFELNAVQFDHQAFSAADLADANSDQFALGANNARRLLASDEQHADHAHTTVVSGVPRAAIRQLAHKSQTKPKRKLLSTMMSISDTLTSTAVMPQGPLKIQGGDTSGSFTSHGTGGFIVQGPSQAHNLNSTEISNDLALNGSSLSDVYRWMERGSFEGFTQTWTTVEQALSSDMFDLDGGAWSQSRWRASIAVGPWIGIIMIIVELACAYLLMNIAMHSSATGLMFGKKELSDGQIQTVRKTHETIFSYSRTFFESPSFNVNFSEDKGTFRSMFGLVLSEFTLILGGYYILAILMIGVSIGFLPFFYVEHRISEPNKKGRRFFRYYVMRFISLIMDKSATETMMTMIFGLCGSETMKKRCKHLCGLKSGPVFLGRIVILLACILLRFTMACTALFFLPFSLLSCMLYFFLILIGRRVVMKGVRCKHGTDLVTHDSEYFLGNKTASSLLPPFPWDLRGAGYGYLEFGDTEELAQKELEDVKLHEATVNPDETQAADSTPSRYAQRRQEHKERQNLIMSDNTKFNFV